MNDMQKRVANWMKNFGQDCPPTPVVPSLEVRKLRAKLILEEALETINGMNVGVYLKNQDDELDCLQDIQDISFVEWDSPLSKPDIIETSDGIADLLVVTLGTAVAHGIDIAPIFEEVMRSNDSKLWNAHEFEEAYPDEGCFERQFASYMCEGDGILKVCVKNRSGKVVKPPSYSPPNILPLLKEQGLV